MFCVGDSIGMEAKGMFKVVLTSTCPLSQIYPAKT